MAGLPALDFNHSITPSVRRIIVLISLLTVASLIPISRYVDLELLALPGVLWLYIGAVGTADAVIALLLFGHARATGERAYLLLAGGYLFAMVLYATWLLTAPGSIVSQVPLLGDFSTSTYVWLTVGIITAVAAAATAVLQQLDRGRKRLPTRIDGTKVGVIATIAAILLSVFFILGADLLPPLLEGEPPYIRVTPQLQQAMVAALVICLVCLAILLVSLRHQSRLHWWLMLSVLMTVASLSVALMGGYRYSLAWYFIRLFGFLASLVLLVLLVNDLRSVDRERVKALTELGAAKRGVDEANLELARVAVTDPLTQLPNRAAFFSTAQRSLGDRESGASLAVAVIDFDGFKAINDYWGHTAGDRILVEVAARLERALAPGEFIARLGGDEFAWLRAETELDRDVVQERLLFLIGTLREPIAFAGQQVLLSASIGYVIDAGGTASADDMTQQADLAMYQAKSLGRNQICEFSANLQDAASRQADIRQTMVRALRDRDVVVHYQPIFDLVTGRLWGREALARLRRPSGEIVAAESFIRMAEVGGQIREVGALVLEQVAAQLPVLLQEADCKVTINLSAQELTDQPIRELLEQSDLWAHRDRIVLEVTESTALHAAGVERLMELRQWGYAVAVDDFGHGYSNLSGLLGTRPDVVKVDRSVTSGLAASTGGGLKPGRQGNHEADSIFAAVLAMAKSLGADLIAEGVETQEQVDALLNLGVTLAQGYGLGRPGPIEDLSRLSRSG